MSHASGVLHDLFFPRSKVSAGPVSPQLIAGTTVYFLLRRERAIKRKQFMQVLLQNVLPNWRRQAALTQTSVALFHLATKGGLEVLPFAAVRSHGALKLPAMLGGMPTPPKFTSNLTPRYDAFVEVKFDHAPTREQIDALHWAHETLKSLCEEVSTCECDRRYNVLGSPPSMGESVYLTVITRTPWNKTREEAQRYWIHEHAQLVSDNVKRTGMCGYQQVHTTLNPTSTFQNSFGGLATIEFPRLSTYLLQTAKPSSLRFNNTLVLDEMNLTIQSEIGIYRRVVVD
ncbi:hypothetical protein ACFFKC_06285 [Pseudoduganella danionis]|uniref:EthD domain-containing protein n=1 Tax=Pseudoduganella danionis TaxID=1890295 RepID=A0ABW9SPU9_9BURK|nr:hypothetical protein [Pseudoduganella danionis]MTW34188.1 hypothetical protein [Pseudoduganella danionis]